MKLYIMNEQLLSINLSHESTLSFLVRHFSGWYHHPVHQQQRYYQPNYPTNSYPLATLLNYTLLLKSVHFCRYPPIPAYHQLFPILVCNQRGRRFRNDPFFWPIVLIVGFVGLASFSHGLYGYFGRLHCWDLLAAA